MGIENLVKKLNKEAGKQLIARANEIVQVPRFGSGSLSLDLELGGTPETGYGFPQGRIISLTGEESAGKSVVALKAVAEFMKKYPEQDVLWIDGEGAFDEVWAKTLGVDPDNPRLYVMRPDFMEQAYNAALLATDENVGLIVIDSLAAMSPKDEAEEEIEKVFVGVAARLNRKLLRKFQGAVNDASFEVPSTLIYINHLNEKIGGMSRPGMPAQLVEPGGRALKYFPSVKIEFKAGDTYPQPKAADEDIQPKARELKFFIKKNKTAPPLRRGHFWFYFDTLDGNRTKGSYDRLEEIIRYSLKYGVVTRVNKSVYALPNPATGELIEFRGSAKVAQHIRDDEPTRLWVEEELARRVTTGMLESGVALSEDPEDELSEEDAEVLAKT